MKNVTNTLTGRATVGLLAAVAVLATGASFGGCGDARAPINNVMTNVVEKSAFTGSWYMTEQVIDFDYEAAALGFVGEISTDGTSGGYAMVRIRWVIDEQNLYAFRDYQTVADAENPFAESEEGFLGQPVAAFRITSHFDIRRAYNATTGEELNQIVENTTDNRWWERRFMRVDWSRNLLSGWYGTSTELRELFGGVRREPTDIFVQSVSSFPEEWRPQFHIMSCNGTDDAAEGCRENDRLWARDYEQGELYSFNFVTQQLWSPTTPNCFFGAGGLCASVLTSIRTAFLRVSDTREYVAENFDDTLFERAGYFRMERDTYDGSVDASDPSFGLTDFRNNAIFRHNIWADWVDDAGNPIPYADRPVREVPWHTSRELPTHLIRPAFEVASEWNSVLMATVRQRRGDLPVPEYPREACQSTDPAGYCFCQAGPGADGMVGTADDTVLNPDCAGRYNPFETPEEAAARGVVNPFQCWVTDEGPRFDGTTGSYEPDFNDPSIVSSDFDNWVQAEMRGTECVLTLTVNGCNDVAVARNLDAEGNPRGTEGLECQERGDLRFNLLSYVDQPGTPFLGVAQFRADPVTGELLGTDANIGGPALEGYRTRALQAFDLISGRITDAEFYTGEDIRAYLEYAGRVDLPAPPRLDFNVAIEANLEGNPAISEEMHNRMDAIMERAELLQGPEGRARLFDRREMLAGSDIERRLMESTEGHVLAGLDYLDPSAAVEGEQLLELASPFRGNFEEMINETSELEGRMNALGMHMPNNFTDDSVLWYVNRVQGAGWTRARVEFDINRRLYRQTEIHEMGHCMGLRHDFSGSTDIGNYAPDYYLIRDAIPLPDPADFDVAGDGMDYDESQAYEAAYSDARSNRELAGIDAWMTSSIMDYTANWYQRIQGSGRHDWMAVALGYTNMVDVYDRGAAPTVDVDDLNPANAGRVYATYYMGGESCSTDADCPYSLTGSLSADLTEANRSGGLVQSCVAHPSVPGRSVCTNYDADAAVVLESATAATRYVPIDYRYCEDYRSATRSLPYCNTFDEGDSFREMVRNAMEGYERSYVFSAFRRYRRNFSVSGYIDGLLRYLFPMINIQQNLMYRYQHDPDFRNQHGPFGFEDEFLATADVLNFMARIMASPGIGSYAYDRDWDWFRRTSSDPDIVGTNLSVRIGQGRFFQSIYQAGLSGINRIERIGSFIDKIITMQLMTIRGLSPFYGPDTIFYTNFYDLFPVEMNQLFTGMVADDANAYMPRVRCGSGTFPTCTDPQLVYMDFYRGDCVTPGSTTCRENPAEITYNRPDLTTINGGDSFLLQSYATIYGLSEFPVYYDTTFDSQMFICIEGAGACTAPADGAVEGVDYVRHTSPRYGLSYLAWQIDPLGGSEASIAFSMVTEARNTDFAARTLRDLRGDFGGAPYAIANLSAAQISQLDAIDYVIPRLASMAIDAARVDTEIDRLQGRAEQLESFFNYVVELEQRYGIVYPGIYTRNPLGE